MDDLDRKILALLAKNARMPVKEIAEKVALTSPAVSSRIHKLETDGIISGYTVMLNRPADRVYVDALISLSVAPSQRDELVELMQNSKEVLQCYHVTGAYTFLIKVSCGSMPQLEHLILQFQKLGTTSTQIILSTPVNHGDLEAMMLGVHRTVTSAVQFSPAVGRLSNSSAETSNTIAVYRKIPPCERKDKTEYETYHCLSDGRYPDAGSGGLRHVRQLFCGRKEGLYPDPPRRPQ